MISATSFSTSRSEVGGFDLGNDSGTDKEGIQDSLVALPIPPLTAVTY